LPDLLERVRKQKAEKEALLVSIGKPVLDRDDVMLTALTQFASAYCSSIKGTNEYIAATEF
jgi:hypothetical protein